MLCLSAAFDTVDHAILLQRLSSDFGVQDLAKMWITSYLTSRQQFVKCCDVSSVHCAVSCGVAPGSVLGLLLFVMYTAGLQDVIRNHNLLGYFYADDSQAYSSCYPSEAGALKATMLRCIDDVSSWMSSNRLKLNPTKTEFMWCFTPQQRHRIDTSSFLLAGATIAPVTSVRLLGVNIDGELTMSSHVNRTISTCFYQLRRMKSIRRSLPMDAAKSVINAFVISRLDYCNGLLAGIIQRQADRLQSILNASARFLYGGARRDHVT